MHLQLLAITAILTIPRGALAQTCTGHSQPNPITKQYPDDVTGTLNGTIAIIPIDYSLARSIVPSKYPILKDAYQSLFPSLPKDKYPMFVQAVLDHDIRSGSLTLSDFSVRITLWIFRNTSVLTITSELPFNSHS